MNIGEAAEASGLPPKTIRYYETIDLVVPDRQDNGYRVYTQKDVHVLRFVQRARGLGFSVSECRSLLSLFGDKRRTSGEVRRLARAGLADISRKVEELQSMHLALGALIEAGHGDDRPDCPVLDDLAGTSSTSR